MGELDDLEAAFAAQVAEHLDETETISAGIEVAAEIKPRGEIAADPLLLQLVENRFRADLVRERELPRWTGELPFHLDPEAWHTGFVSIVEGGPPLSIREGLLENTPQANLRDLFRPEWENTPVALERHDLQLDPGGRNAFAELRQARTLEPLPRIERLATALNRLEIERRAFLAQPWKPFLDDSAPRREVAVLIEPAPLR